MKQSRAEGGILLHQVYFLYERTFIKRRQIGVVLGAVLTKIRRQPSTPRRIWGKRQDIELLFGLHHLVFGRRSFRWGSCAWAQKLGGIRGFQVAWPALHVRPYGLHVGVVFFERLLERTPWGVRRTPDGQVAFKVIVPTLVRAIVVREGL